MGTGASGAYFCINLTRKRRGHEPPRWIRALVKEAETPTGTFASYHPPQFCLIPINNILLKECRDSDWLYFSLSIWLAVKASTVPQRPDYEACPLHRASVVSAPQKTRWHVHSPPRFHARNFSNHSRPLQFHRIAQPMMP